MNIKIFAFFIIFFFSNIFSNSSDFVHITKRTIAICLSLLTFYEFDSDKSKETINAMFKITEDISHFFSSSKKKKNFLERSYESFKKKALKSDYLKVESLFLRWLVSGIVFFTADKVLDRV